MTRVVVFIGSYLAGYGVAGFASPNLPHLSQRLPQTMWWNDPMTTTTSPEVRIYGKNLRNPRKGKSYWTDISIWKSDRFEKTGRFPITVNVTTKSTESWSRNLSPIRIGSVDTYEENGSRLVATSVELAWQYSKIYSHRNEDGKLIPLNFTDSQGRPNSNWFRWRDEHWNKPEFHWNHPEFEKNKKLVRRGFPKGSPVSSFYWNGKLLNPVEARRSIYANLYCREVVRTTSYQQLETLHKSGDLAIFDFDGYDYKELGMTPEDTIRDLNHSWGHGLVLSLLLQGIDPRRLF